MTERAHLDARDRQRRFAKGDGVDWPHMFYEGKIDEQTLFEKTGFTRYNLRVTVVPVPDFAPQDGH